MTYDITDLTPAQADFIKEKIAEANDLAAPPLSAGERFVLKVTDGGDTVGGLISSIDKWNTLELENLWIDERFRGRRLASALIRSAERYARERGCALSIVATWDYQARPLYEKHGYTLRSTITDWPKGHESYYLSKRLDQSADASTDAFSGIAGSKRLDQSADGSTGSASGVAGSGDPLADGSTDAFSGIAGSKRLDQSADGSTDAFSGVAGSKRLDQSADGSTDVSSAIAGSKRLDQSADASTGAASGIAGSKRLDQSADGSTDVSSAVAGSGDPLADSPTGSGLEIAFGGAGDADFIHGKLHEYNCAKVPRLHAHIRRDKKLSDGGVMIAGCAADIDGLDIAVIEAIWVDGARRGEGIGTRLLGEVERQIKAAGALFAVAYAFDWQSGFFEKNGYSLCGEIAGRPATGSFRVLKKTL